MVIHWIPMDVEVANYQKTGSTEGDTVEKVRKLLVNMLKGALFFLKAVDDTTLSARHESPCGWGGMKCQVFQKFAARSQCIHAALETFKHRMNIFVRRSNISSAAWIYGERAAKLSKHLALHKGDLQELKGCGYHRRSLSPRNIKCCIIDDSVPSPSYTRSMVYFETWWNSTSSYRVLGIISLKPGLCKGYNIETVVNDVVLDETSIGTSWTTVA